jgi:hypothetical protein
VEKVVLVGGHMLLIVSHPFLFTYHWIVKNKLTDDK